MGRRTRVDPAQRRRAVVRVLTDPPDICRPCLLRHRTRAHLAALKRNRREASTESTEERARRQRVRAEETARALTGGRITHGLLAAILELVKADEREEPRGEPSEPAPGARQVLKPKRRGASGKAAVRVRESAVQEGLW